MDHPLSLGPELYQLKQHGLVKDDRKEGGFTLVVTAEDLFSFGSLAFSSRSHIRDNRACEQWGLRKYRFKLLNLLS